MQACDWLPPIRGELEYIKHDDSQQTMYPNHMSIWTQQEGVEPKTAFYFDISLAKKCIPLTFPTRDLAATSEWGITLFAVTKLWLILLQKVSCKIGPSIYWQLMPNYVICWHIFVPCIGPMINHNVWLICTILSSLFRMSKQTQVWMTTQQGNNLAILKH